MSSEIKFKECVEERFEFDADSPHHKERIRQERREDTLGVVYMVVFIVFMLLLANLIGSWGTHKGDDSPKSAAVGVQGLVREGLGHEVE